MKNFVQRACWLLTLTFILAGCSSGDLQATIDQQNQEIERLKAENQDLEKLKADNEEVQRLRKENQELSRLRGQYQELARLRKENEQLKQQEAKRGTAAPRPGAP